MSVVIDQNLIDKVVELTLQASEAILDVYHREDAGGVMVKPDCSPVTDADIAAHEILDAGLRNLLPKIPVLSEETEMPSVEERRSWSCYWLVDPLDGTKEFIEKNNEFTVNVALIQDGYPVLGVVTVPVTGVSYWGARGLGACKIEKQTISPISARKMPFREQNSLPLTIVASRRHGNQAMNVLMGRLEEHFETVCCKNMGSSLKLCLIAEGEADLYPRLAPTSEWDTAAAQAVVEAAGGQVVDESFNRLIYNNKESLLNPYFYVLADTAYRWEHILPLSLGDEDDDR